MKNRKELFSWLYVVAWMILIFCFSAQNGTESGELSDHLIVSLLLPVFDFFHIPLQDIHFISFLARKTAHMFVYFVLAILAIHALFVSNWFQNALCHYGMALLISFLYACTDEWHQHFIPGRHMAFSDVLVDTAGAMLGLLFFFCFKAITQKKRRR